MEELEILLEQEDLEELEIELTTEVGTFENLNNELIEQNGIIITQKSIIEQILELLKIEPSDDGTLTAEQIEALNNAIISIENGELIFDYDDEVLKLDFNIENKNLMVTNNVTGTDFNINQNGELEVSY